MRMYGLIMLIKYKYKKRKLTADDLIDKIYALKMHEVFPKFPYKSEQFVPMFKKAYDLVVGDEKLLILK